MPKRKVIIEVEIRDDRINSIEDLEQEILPYVYQLHIRFIQVLM
ncbi:MAG: hypothetical protein ACNYWM_09085 [Methanosarcinales archaeon]|jgi:methyl coenzyme M reductase subunit D